MKTKEKKFSIENFVLKKAKNNNNFNEVKN